MQKLIFLLIFFLFFHNLYAKDEYFLTLRNDKVNLRQGPSFDYPVKIFYKKKFLPVLIQDRSDNYRMYVCQECGLVAAVNEKDNNYDALLCVGTFTFGHVKPPALDEFIRITKNNGLICFTINEGIHEEYGFDKKIQKLTEEKKWKELEFFKSDYIASKDVNAWLGLYEVTK